MPPDETPEVADRAREEFYAEADDIVEQLARDLLALDDGFRRGRTDPETLNNVFRGVHTLKGLAGLFGLTRLATLAHDLEDLLDQLRMGRAELTQEVIDQLFRAIEVVGRVLESGRAGVEDESGEVDRFLRDLRRSPKASVAPALRGDYDLDPALFAVLTEYEEHRLHTNIADRVPLYRIRARFDLAAIDRGLEDLKAIARPLGEIITYLPSGGGEGDVLELEILFASNASLDQLRGRLEDPTRSIVAVARRGTDPPVPGAAVRSARPSAPARPDSNRVIAPEATGASRGPAQGTLDVAVEDELAPVNANRGATRAVHSVRVDIRRLDQLMNILSELSLVRSELMRLADRVRQDPTFRVPDRKLRELHREFDRNLEGMQRGILEVRMVPLGQIFERLAREVRKISRELAKEIRLVVTGAETAVDKLIVEELGPPLLHLVRNAIDHGIEAPEARQQLGKPVEGTIAFNAFHAGNHVVIEVEDDGAGVDHRALRQVALRRGIVSEADARDLSRRDLLRLVFAPGLSTRDEVTELSGRGVGMDVVKTNLARLGGVVDIASEVGIYTKVTITLPITLAILSALVVVVAGRRYCVPLSSVAEATRLRPDGVRHVDGREVTSLNGRTLMLCRLDRLFGHVRVSPAPLAPYVVVVALGGRQVGFVVDELEGQQDIVIKPLGPSLAGVRGFSGASDLGDQQVGLVLDAVALLDEVLAGASERRAVEVQGGRRS